jgi:multimeric flavodoxin WrbA
MNILVLNGSPKKTGNISCILQEICRGFSENGHQINNIFLKDLSIADCEGCMACQSKGACVIRDDIAKVEVGIKEADILVIGTPVHWGNMSAILLRIFERMFGFLIEERPDGFPVPRNGKGKRAIIVTSCSTAWPFNWIFNQSRSVFSRLHEIFRYSDIKIIKKHTLAGTIRQKRASDKDKMKAFKIGLTV